MDRNLEQGAENICSLFFEIEVRDFISLTVIFFIFIIIIINRPNKSYFFDRFKPSMWSLILIISLSHIFHFFLILKFPSICHLLLPTSKLPFLSILQHILQVLSQRVLLSEMSSCKFSSLFICCKRFLHSFQVFKLYCHVMVCNCEYRDSLHVLSFVT